MSGSFCLALPSPPGGEAVKRSDLVLQRYDPGAGMQQMADLWTLTKGDQLLICAISTHPLGWELRLVEAPHVIRSQVCRTQADVFKAADKWKMLAILEDWKAWD